MIFKPKSNWNPAGHPLPPEKELRVEYDAELDILTLWTGTPASNATVVARNLQVFFDDEDVAHIVALEGAAKLLRPYLFPED